MAEAVRAAQREGDSGTSSDTADSTLARAEVAWRTALEQAVEEEAAQARRARADAEHLTAALAEAENTANLQRAEAEARIGELEDRLRVAEEGLAAASDESTRLSATIALAEVAATTAEVRESELRETVRALEAAQASLDQTTARLSAALTAAESRETAQRVSADTQLDGLRAELARVQLRLDQTEQELATAEKENARLSVDVADIESAFESARLDAEGRVGELAARVQVAEAGRSAAEQELARVADELTAQVVAAAGDSPRRWGGDTPGSAAQTSGTISPPDDVEAAEPAPTPPAATAGADEVVRFTPKRRAPALLTVLAGLGALAAAGVAVAMAVDGRLVTPVGIAASAVTVVLALGSALSRTRSTKIWIDAGTVHVEGPAGHHQFDLTSENTRVEMVGEPGRRGWRVKFLRPAMAPFVVDASMVDGPAFTDAVRRWRPDL